ncbi:MAG: cyclic nucleotide-binding domain-containing protein [Gammaproteobacteria bacterium]|jgi:CRP-like cAMP-binding protein
MNTHKQQGNRFSGKDILRDLIPLNGLTEDRYREITGSLAIEDISAGSYLFGEGDRDNKSIYLLDGVINFIDANGRVTGVVSAGTTPARYPIANQQPRITTARAASKAVIASIDSTLLDVMLTLDQSQESGPVKTSTDSGKDWLTRMLQSEAFIKLTPTDIQKLLQKLQSVPVKEGEVVIQQGDSGDYFYIIREGRCSVTRLASGKGWDIPLAELSDGDCFGEEALVSDNPRNATITMLTDGTLMRLSKQDFVELLKKPLLHYIDYDLAMESVREGDIWLDVRLQEEHANYAFDGSINVPLAMIRDKAPILVPGKKYIVYCDTGRRSAAAAFLLSQRGLDVSVLEGGLNKGVPSDILGLFSDMQPSDSAHASLDMPAPAGGNNSADETAAHPVSQEILQEKDAALQARDTAEQRVDILEKELAALKSELDRYLGRVKQMEDAWQAAGLARDSITRHIERLMKSVTRSSRQP